MLFPKRSCSCSAFPFSKASPFRKNGSSPGCWITFYAKTLFYEIKLHFFGSRCAIISRELRRHSRRNKGPYGQSGRSFQQASGEVGHSRRVVRSTHEPDLGWRRCPLRSPLLLDYGGQLQRLVSGKRLPTSDYLARRGAEWP